MKILASLLFIVPIVFHVPANFPNRVMQYIRDNVAWDFEREQTPAQDALTTLRKGTGVCRDIAVLAGWYLDRAGYEPEQIVFGMWDDGYFSHEGVLFYDQNELCFIDNYNLTCGFENVNEVVEYVRVSQGVKRVCNWKTRNWDNTGPIEIWC